MTRVGLTGGIASGKSTVCRMFREKGCQIIDADQVAHGLIRREQPCFEAVVKKFGREILDPSGEINRKKLGEIVFEDRSKLESLNSIVHPEVIRTILAILAGREKEHPRERSLVEASLMIESGFYKSFQRLIVVTCSPEQQMERLMARNGLSAEQSRNRVSLQMPLDEKIRFADFVVDNSGSLENTQAQVNHLFQKLEDTLWATSL
ncbi:MAG: dephospho-CoA kinase [Terriglobia bacterium]